MTKILLIEDDMGVAAFIKKGLTENNYEIEYVKNGEEGLRLALDKNYNVIILDVIMPKMNGYEVCKNIRKHNTTIPILMLTALGATPDKILGLDSGADDYLVKPFDFSELLARIRALLRRNDSRNAQQILKLNDLELSINSKRVYRNSIEIKLTAKEFALLLYFMKNKDKILSRNELSVSVWDINFDTGTNVVDVYVNYLRNKIDKGYENKFIHTVVGMGYIFKEN